MKSCQNFDFPQSSLTVGLMLKGTNLLDGNLLSRLIIESWARKNRINKPTGVKSKSVRENSTLTRPSRTLPHRYTRVQSSVGRHQTPGHELSRAEVWRERPSIALATTLEQKFYALRSHPAMEDTGSKVTHKATLWSACTCTCSTYNVSLVPRPEYMYMSAQSLAYSQRQVKGLHRDQQTEKMELALT